MMTKQIFSFTSKIFPYNKRSSIPSKIQNFEEYLFFPAKSPTLIISGSIVTITSLSQWNLFDLKNFSGGSLEPMIIINTLSILQFFLGCRSYARKEKTKKIIQDFDADIIKMQNEINSLKSRITLN